MSIQTMIQWCDSTVNPVMGCDGCELWNDERRVCYAGVLHRRFGGATVGYAPRFEEVTNFPGRMATAAAWPDLRGTRRTATARRPAKPWLDGCRRVIFVSDMGDSLSASVTFQYLHDEVYRNVVSAQGRRHIWMWLTKRPERMASFAHWVKETHGGDWPENLWPGTSVTTQKSAGRIDSLLRIGGEGTTRFLSVEPQWEPLDLSGWLGRGVGWVIQGGESGRNATPFLLEWATTLIRQCQDVGITYFLKQLGSHVLHRGERLHFEDGQAGDPAEWPEGVRQARQVPGAAA